MKLTSLVLVGLLGFTDMSQQPQRPIEYSPKVIDILVHLYNKHPREFPLCQLGQKRNGTYYIQDVSIPHVFYTDSIGTNYDANDCRKLKNYLGMIHNHINKNPCAPGLIDMIRFTSKAEERTSIESVVCHTSLDSNSVNIVSILKTRIPDSMIKRLRFLADSLKIRNNK